MSSDDSVDIVANAIELFIQGAKTLYLGYFLERDSMQSKGFKIINRAIEAIDQSSSIGRDVLLPLLDSTDEGVQMTAAAGLWQSRPERVKSLLTYMQDHAVTEASQVAIVLLMTRGQLNPCGSDPRYPALDSGLHWAKALVFEEAARSASSTARPSVPH